MFNKFSKCKPIRQLYSSNIYVGLCSNHYYLSSVDYETYCYFNNIIYYITMLKTYY